MSPDATGPVVPGHVGKAPSTRRQDPGRRAERPVTVKLEAAAYDCLSAVALVEETTAAEQVRRAVTHYVEIRLADPRLEEKVAGARARQDATLALLLRSDEEPAEPARPGTSGGLDTPGGSDGPGAAGTHRRPAQEKPVTLRIGTKDFDLLNALALLDATTMATQLRAAVDGYVRLRLADPDLAARIDLERERHRRVLAPLV